MSYDFDFFVIGAGSGGVRSARVAANLGAKVGIAEDRYLGGTCVNVGCVPKKLYVYGSHFSEDFSLAKSYGWDVGSAFLNWDTLLKNKNDEIERLNNVYANLLDKANVELLPGRAKFIDAHTLEINDEKEGSRRITADKILIATGAWPFVPDVPGKEHAITSNDAFYIEQLPHSIAIVGGGYIAVEFAGIFHGMGVETHLIYRGPLFLRGFDQSVREHMATNLEKKGIHVHFNTDVTAINRNGRSLSLTLNDGQTLDTESVMYATGRVPKIEGLGLENINITLTGTGHIAANTSFQTSTPNVYAVGDVIGGKELTPVAIAEGSAVANSLFGSAVDVDYEHIATAVFSQPNIATVGMTEEEAREQYGDVRIYETSFKHMKHSFVGDTDKTFMKLIVEDQTDKVVGCHMIGADAGEIIQGIAVAMKAGATKAHFDSTIGIHPTAAEEFVTMREVTRR
ncbi:glutathione-disulfide reductase [Aurantivibrio plasticivorans]